MKTANLLMIFGGLIFFFACNAYKELPTENLPKDWKVKRIPATVQNENGDPKKGLEYLIYGDYIGSGIPWTMLEKKLENFRDTVLKRDGKNGRIPFAMNLFKAPNGTEVVSGNCFSCHASRLNKKTVLGLGDTFAGFDEGKKIEMSILNFAVKTKFKKGSPERAAFEDYGYFVKHILPHIKTPMKGVNPAFRLEEACFQNRDPEDLKLNRKDRFDIIKYTLASDTPPLWNVKKKNALYYNGMGRGDFTKLLMQASVLGIPDSTEAGKVHNNFKDVLAWLKSLEPPKYPQNIDRNLAQKGKTLFENECAKCHGFYEGKEAYPNKLVSLEVVKTDPYYARYFTQKSKLAKWYNDSWFANSEPHSRLKPSEGYFAPPLDGIWATAPYLHNGSVPDLDALLNSKSRPIFWLRTARSDDFNYEKVGWNYTVVENSKEDWTYDTTLPGYGNQGHYFGDKFSNDERKAVIEYLKTL